MRRYNNLPLDTNTFKMLWNKLDKP